MSTVIGIDTGGTFTDGVIVDLETKKVLAAVKSPTTHKDLMIGIRESIMKLSDYDLKSASYIAISTTLATNAIVENRGCRVGLLLLGHEPDVELPKCELEIVKGKHNIRGEETEPLDTEEVMRAIENMRGKVDSVAVSGICSVRNPEHEVAVKKMVMDILGVPVVAAHELASALGINERTVTCVLNARLVYVIDNLLTAVKKVLKEVGLDIPIMVVKGDGSLMNESITREKPIETILSGPAASIIGATYLNGATDGLVLDMGGTTTDIAILKKGLPRLDKDGAKVGGWKTRVAAVEVTTAGLGGDSRIHYDEFGTLRVGPRRSWPVSIIAKNFPHYADEVYVAGHSRVGMFKNEPFEGYFLLRHPSPFMELTDVQKQVLEAVADGPHTLYTISKKTGVPIEFLHVETLIDHAILGTIGFTPTDILVYEGDYSAGHQDTAGIAARVMSRKFNNEIPAFIKAAREAINDRMCRVILDSALTYEKINIDPFNSTDIFEYFFKKAIKQGEHSIFQNIFRLDIPIIGIGAPTKFWLPPASEVFHTESVFPDYNYAANAVGAAVGKVMSIMHIVVENLQADGAVIFAPWGRTKINPIGDSVADTMEHAVKEAEFQGRRAIAQEMKKQGITDYEILVDKKESVGGVGEKVPIEVTLDVSAVGRMKNANEKEKRHSMLGAFWGKDKVPDYSMIPPVT